MNNWKVILATIVIFGAGVVTGGLLVSHVEHSHPKNSKRTDAAVVATNAIPQTNSSVLLAVKPVRLPEILNKQFLQRLDEQLHLSGDQREAIQKIIADGQNLMRKTMQDARLEIREQLSPDQRSQFDDLIKHPLRRSGSGTNAPVVSPAAARTPAASQ